MGIDEEIKKSLTEIRELMEIGPQDKTDDQEDNSDTLELALEELRIIYGRLDESLATIKVRVLTFLGAALALLSYLYGSETLFIPAQNYGRVFYFLGLGLVVSAIGFLLRALKAMAWSVPIESKLTKIRLHKKKHELLELLVEEYIECMIINLGRYETKVADLNSGFFQLLCGSILLLVIKSIGG